MDGWMHLCIHTIKLKIYLNNVYSSHVCNYNQHHWPFKTEVFFIFLSKLFLPTTQQKTDEMNLFQQMKLFCAIRIINGIHREWGHIFVALVYPLHALLTPWLPLLNRHSNKHQIKHQQYVRFWKKQIVQYRECNVMHPTGGLQTRQLTPGTMPDKQKMC